MSNRLIAISDVHGYYEELLALLKKIDYKKEEDKIVFIGDMVDRGPEPIKTISLIRNLQLAYPKNVFVVKGNHDKEFSTIAKILQKGQTLSEEDWLLYAGFTGDDLNGINTLKNLFSYKDRELLINWIDNLPLYVDIDNHIFIHAGMNPNIPMDSQSEQVLLWGKENKEDRLFIWNNVNKHMGYENKVIVFGHVDTSLMYKKYENKLCNDIWYDLTNYDKIGIDCGVWNKGKLGALIIEPKIFDKGLSYSEEYVSPIEDYSVDEQLVPRPKSRTTSTFKSNRGKKTW